MGAEIRDWKIGKMSEENYTGDAGINEGKVNNKTVRPPNVERDGSPAVA